MRLHQMPGPDALDQCLHGAATALDPEQSRLDDLRVVDDEQVAFAQQRRQCTERPVDDETVTAVEQARTAAFGRRMLRDQLGWQLEIEVGERVARRGRRGDGGHRDRVEAERAGRRAKFSHGLLLVCAPCRGSADGPAKPALAAADKTKAAPTAAVAAASKALEKLGLVRDIDLALHLPLRYEDETRIVPIAELRDGIVGQVEGDVVDAKIQFRPRRQLVVTIQDGSADLVLRFLHFYPSQQKTYGPGKRLRVRGEARGGFFGIEMVHPVVKPVTASTPLPTSLTPVYPSTVQLSQAVLRQAVAHGLAHADLDDILPAGLAPAGLPSLREALARLHHPAPGLDADALEDRSHPAWQRLKFDELLAQQLSQLQAKQERELQRAPAFASSQGQPGPKTPATIACTTTSWPSSRSRSPMRSGASSTRSRAIWHGRSRCTACCRATSAPARQSSQRWRRPASSMPAGNAR